jgi:hypothetical protein
MRPPAGGRNLNHSVILTTPSIISWGYQGCGKRPAQPEPPHRVVDSMFWLFRLWHGLFRVRRYRTGWPAWLHTGRVHSRVVRHPGCTRRRNVNLAPNRHLPGAGQHCLLLEG